MAERSLHQMPHLGGLYAKVARSLLPGSRALPTRADSTPTTLRLDGVSLDRSRLAAYRDLCGFVGGDDVPATYPQVVAFPLQLMLMTESGFPFGPIGLVHIGNQITQTSRLSIEEPLELTVSRTDPEPHPRGRRLTVVTSAVVSGREVWRAEMVLLKRETVKPGDQPEVQDVSPEGAAPVPSDPPMGPQVWRLAGNLGRRYASVSGDRNPIHLYDLTAKPLGFAHHIAHGMWTHARALAELTNRLPHAYRVDVAFKRPIVLPGTVRFGARRVDGVLDFGVSSAADGSPHLLGRVTPLDVTPLDAPAAG